MTPIPAAVLEPQGAAARAMLTEALEPFLSLRFAESDALEDRLAVAAGADVWIAGGLPLGDPFFDGGPARVVHVLGTGSDQIDVERARREDCSVLVASGSNATAVAEMAIVLMLAVLRNLTRADAELRAGRYRKAELRASNFMLAGKRVGILGMGYVGRELANRLLSFECSVAYFDERRDVGVEELGVDHLPLEDLLRRSELLSVHLPLTPSTESILSRERLALLPEGAIVVNTARGGLIDEDALVDAIRSGAILGAGLDVQRVEPPPRDDPLLTLDRVILTPHVAGAVLDNLARVAERASQNLRAFFADRPIDAADVVVDARPVFHESETWLGEHR